MSELGIYLINQASGEKHLLNNGSNNIIGRGVTEKENPEASILLPHPAISKKHAAIFIDEDTHKWTIQNYGSNGTHVNGSIAKRKILKHGDEILIGPYKLSFYEAFGKEGTVEFEMPTPIPDEKEIESMAANANVAIYCVVGIAWIIIFFLWIWMKML